MPKACFSSRTSCQAFRASHRLMNPGEPLSTAERPGQHSQPQKPPGPQQERTLPRAAADPTAEQNGIRFLTKQNLQN